MSSDDRWLYGWGLGYVAVGGASLLVPVYALALGAGPFLVGLLASTAAFAGVPGALLWGRLAERSGRRRPFVLFALAATSVILAGMSLVRDSLALLALNAGLWFVVAAAAPVCNLVMVEGYPDAKWDDRLARINAVQGWGWVAGLVLGVGWLAAGATVATPADVLRSLLVVLSGAAAVATVVVRLRFAPEGGVSPSRFRERFGRLQGRDLGAGRIIRLLPYGPGRIYWSLRRLDRRTLRRELSGSLGIFLAGTTAFALGSAVFWGPMPAYLDAGGLSAVAIFVVFLVGNVGSALSYGRVASLVTRLGIARIQLGAIGARTILFPATVLVAGGALPVLALVFALVGVSWALAAVTGPVLVSRLAPAGERPAALATYTATMSAGTGVGSVVGGALATATGYLVTFSVAGLVVLVGVGLAWRGLGGPGTFMETDRQVRT